jgi:hypothetical protein
MESITQETQDILQMLSTQFQQIYPSLSFHLLETFICIYGKLLFPKQYVHPFFGEPENNLLFIEQ